MSEVSFTGSETSMTAVRNALSALHAKVAMLEKDRDAHHQLAVRARSEHEEYKLRMEAEINRERLIAAQRERQLLEDVAAAEADINHLKEKLRQSNLNPLPRANLKTEYDAEFERRTAEALQTEQARIREAQHEIEKLHAERQVLESANVQLDSTIQHLLRSNEELLHMLRVVPRKADQEGNPAAAVAGAMAKSSPSGRHGLPLGAGMMRSASPSTAAAAAAAAALSSSSSYNHANAGPLNQPPLRFQSPRPAQQIYQQQQQQQQQQLNVSVERHTMSSRAHHGRPVSGNISKKQKLTREYDLLWDRLAQPRSCSRQRAGTPPRLQHGHMGTSKNTARKFLTQELRAHAQAAVPH